MKKTYLNLLGILLLFILWNNVHASGTENFDSYSTGDLSGENGGSGWLNDWTCNIANYFNVVTDQTISSPNSTKHIGNGADNGSCTRPFTTGLTEGEIYEFHARAAQNDKFFDTYLLRSGDGAQIIVITFQVTGQIQIINNLTVTNLQAYSANTWYKIEVRIDSYSGKTWSISIDDGSWQGSYTFYNNNSATSVDQIYFQSVWVTSSGGSFWWEDIGGVAAPPPPPPPTSGLLNRSRVSTSTATTSVLESEDKMVFYGILLYFITAILTYILYRRFFT